MVEPMALNASVTERRRMRVSDLRPYERNPRARLPIPSTPTRRVLRSLNVCPRVQRHRAIWRNRLVCSLARDVPAYPISLRPRGCTVAVRDRELVGLDRKTIESASKCGGGGVWVHQI